jgi:hypothetical protein
MAYDMAAAMELRRLRLRRFKAFEAAEIEVSPLTILIGPNNAGKSTILQALILLAQSATGAQFQTRGYVDLGNDPRSLTHQSENVSGPGEEWGIEVEWEAPIPGGAASGLSGPARVKFEATYVDGAPNFRTDVSVSLEVMNRTVTAHGKWPGEATLLIEAPEHRGMRETWQAIKEEVALNQHGPWLFQPRYNPAQRFEVSQLSIGQPESIVLATIRTIEPLLNIAQNVQSFRYIGPDRHVPFSVYSLGQQSVSDARSPQQLIDLLVYRDDIAEQVSQRMIEVFGIGVGTKIEPPQQVSLVGLVGGRKRNVVNLGSGFVQLTWIAAGIEAARFAAREAKAAPIPVVGVEEPELHLHPRLQTDAARILSSYSQSGTQIICTSQSEHFLMALLQGVLDEKIKPEELAVYYIENGQAERLTVDKLGRLSGGLKGFFEADESELLTRIRRLMQRV